MDYVGYGCHQLFRQYANCKGSKVSGKQDKMKVLTKILHHHCGPVVRVMFSVNSEPTNLGVNVRLSLLNLLFEIGPWNIKSLGSPVHRSRVIAPLNCLIASTVFVQESHVCNTDQAT